MAGYFERLVARSLQPQAEIQPRLPARFEPLAPRLGLLWGPGDELEEQVKTRPAPQRAAPPAPAQANLANPPPAKPPAEQAAFFPAPLERRRAENTRLPTSRRAPAAELLPAQVPEPREAPRAVPTAAPASQAGLPRPLRPESPLPAAASPALSSVPPAPAPNQANRQEAAPQAPPQQPGRVVVQPAILPAPPEPRPEATPAQAGVPPEPPRQVNVTIGRIEVRAAQPGAPEKKARPAAPVMGLDEYLKKRTGGQR